MKIKKEMFVKSIISTLFILMILVASERAFAQTGSDYYLPLRVGNYLQFHTNGSELGWAARTSMHVIGGSDSIAGKLYFMERDSESADDNSFHNVFGVFWLRKDSVGNVALGAINTSTGSPNIDSALIFGAPAPFFTSQALVPGYSTTYPYSNYFMDDSTISDSETVNVPAGTFTHCVEMSETHYDSLGDVIFLEYHYYAQGVGMILNVRVKPDSDAHTDALIGYSAVTSVHGESTTNTPSRFGLSQNYPNPFNPTTVISYQLSVFSNVTLKVYDVLGREVGTLVNERQTAGSHSVTFNAANLPSGVYFYHLQAGSYGNTKKLLLLK